MREIDSMRELLDMYRQVVREIATDDLLLIPEIQEYCRDTLDNDPAFFQCEGCQEHKTVSEMVRYPDELLCAKCNERMWCREC